MQTIADRYYERVRGILFLIIILLGSITFLWIIPIPLRDAGGELESTGYGVFSWTEVSVNGRTTTSTFGLAWNGRFGSVMKSVAIYCRAIFPPA